MVKRILKIIGLTIVLILTGLFLSNVYYAHKLRNKFTGQHFSASEIKETEFVKELEVAFANKVWSGFDTIHIPLILYNDSMAFMTGFNYQPEGWIALESEENGVTGPIYLKQAINPQAFAVQVDSVWVASLGTINQMNRSMFWGLRSEMPALMGSVFPFFLIQVREDMHITGIFHEIFHAFQATQNEQKFLNADNSNVNLKNYPYGNRAFSSAWDKEGKFLLSALESSDKSIMTAYIDSFLVVREMRREQSRITPELIQTEKELEWLEGLAKYAEYESYKLAVNMESPYNFKEKNAYWQRELQQRLKKLGTIDRDNRFYGSGVAQAILLDRLNPDWKKSIMNEGIYQEDLLRKYSEKVELINL